MREWWEFEWQKMYILYLVVQFSHSLMFNPLWPWTATGQASRSIPNSWSLLKLMCIESVMPSNHLVLYRPPSPAFNLSQHQHLFQWVSSLHQVGKYWSFSVSISPSNEYSGLIFFGIDWFDLIAAQGTLKSLFQHHSSKASIIWHSVFFMVQISHPYMTTEKNHSFN